jgi:hypothetical protein
MIEAINAIEALGLFWFVRRCDVLDPEHHYRAVVWQGIGQGNLMVSAESGSPTTALALAGRAACRALGLREESERTGESYDEIVQRWGCEKRPNPRSKHANPNSSPSSHSRATGHH